MLFRGSDRPYPALTKPGLAAASCRTACRLQPRRGGRRSPPGPAGPRLTQRGAEQRSASPRLSPRGGCPYRRTLLVVFHRGGRAGRPGHLTAHFGLGSGRAGPGLTAAPRRAAAGGAAAAAGGAGRSGARLPAPLRSVPLRSAPRPAPRRCAPPCPRRGREPARLPLWASRSERGGFSGGIVPAVGGFLSHAAALLCTAVYRLASAGVIQVL